MGKRKRKADNNKTPPPSDITPYAPQELQHSGQRSSEQAESSATQPTSSIMDVMGSSHKRSQGHQSHLNQNHSSNRAMLLRHSRHIFGRHYSRRSSAANHFDASPSNWKGTPVYDAKLSFKLASKDISNSHYRESMDRAFHKPERIRSSSSVLNFVSADVRKVECGICQKRLKKKPFNHDNSITPNDVSVVAVLVCGHAYHADCLEQKTRHEDRQDPPCPSCLSQDNIIGDA